jgi:transcriptional regulator with XRE-family HTH domain
MSAVTVRPDLALVVRARQLAGPRGAKIRQTAGLSQSELAGAVGVTPAAICRWEHEERKPRGVAAVRYAQVLNMLDGMSEGDSP